MSRSPAAKRTLRITVSFDALGVTPEVFCVAFRSGGAIFAVFGPVTGAGCAGRKKRIAAIASTAPVAARTVHEIQPLDPDAACGAGAVSGGPASAADLALNTSVVPVRRWVALGASVGGTPAGGTATGDAGQSN